MDEFEKWRNSPLWDDERSRNFYIYPLKIKREVARREGARLAVGNPPDETYRRGPFYCATSPQSHVGPHKWAIDFLVPDGTPVLAGADGTVVEVQESHDRWGETAEYRDYLNFLTIAHENGEFTQYCHLGKMSVLGAGVRYLDRVKRGQKIGVVGKTGWTDRDHLHFVVFRGARNESPFNFKSLRPRFWWLLTSRLMEIV